PGNGSDAARRLVQKDDARLVKKRHRERELLPPAQWNRSHQFAGGVTKAEASQHGVPPIANLTIRQIVDTAVELDVFGNRQILVEGKTLPHVPVGCLYGFAG